MKKVRFWALLLVVVSLAACAAAEALDPVVIKAVVIKVGDTEILLSQVQEIFDYLYNEYNDYLSNYGMTLGADEIALIRDEAINCLIQDTVISRKIEEYGLGEITEEDMAAYRKEAEENFENELGELQNYYGISREEGLQLLEDNGYTKESEVERYLANIPNMRLYQLVTGDTVVDQAKVDAEYAKRVEDSKASYGDDAATYEIRTNYYGSEGLYVPAGYRMIKHILLDIPEQIAAEIEACDTDIAAAQSAVDALNDELYALENEAEPVDDEEIEPRAPEAIQADIDAKKAELAEMEEKCAALRETILPALTAQVDEILGKLKSGATFDSLIAEYGKDPGMAYYAEGYMVHKNSVVWDTTFRDTAMALEKVGDVSEPVLTQFGVHLIQYVGDVPGGALPITEALAEEIRAALLAKEQSAAFDTQYQAWVDEYSIEVHPELIVLPQAQAAPAGEVLPEGDAEDLPAEANERVG
ncbi:MAG: peptidylprolyl isomerase [Firmicutes bacterium]|nr:peptidylprolyl isomerase [Bacillota bacterium]